MEQARKHDVVVVGAGVIGLQSAVTLLEAGHRVWIVAKHLPGDESIEYTSPWAGAHWRPHGTASDREQSAWDIQSYREWMRIHLQEVAEGVAEAKRSGILPIRSRMLWDSSSHPELQPTGRPADIWFANQVDHFKATQPPGGCAAAAQFTALSVNVPKFLAYLARRVAVLGGSIRRADLPLGNGLETAMTAAAQAAGVTGKRPMFVNATGMAARKLCKDNNVYPARGQTLLVKGVANGCVTRQGENYIAYCIPRPGSGTTIVGGTKQANRWDATEDEHDTASILRRAKDICPELLTPFKDKEHGHFQVLKVNVGLRPMRHGGARMEMENLADGSCVVHAYGHGGAGFQNSYGVAKNVLHMVRSADRFRTNDPPKL